MSKKSKFYVVWNGRKKGVFYSWEDCAEQVKGFIGASYKSYESEGEAIEAFEQGAAKNVAEHRKDTSAHHDTPIWESLAVDAACSGNPGPLEYRGVWTKTQKEIFHSKLYPLGTVNMGEFLAIVHALALCKQKNVTLPIYTDSVTALAWVRNKRIKTNMERTSHTHDLFEHLDKALLWLQNNTYQNVLLKWQTEKWGEIPADFGRKS